MRELSIRNNAKNLQLMALYEKIQETDSHPNIDRTSILDRALDYAIANVPDFSYLAAVKLDLPTPNLIKSPEIFHIKASEEKLNIVSSMLRECFDISIVQIPFLIKLVLTSYYIDKIQNISTKSFSECDVMHTTRIRRAISELIGFLEEIEGQNIREIERIIHKIQKSFVQELVDYDFKNDFFDLISDGANKEWNKCNENLSEGNKLNREADFKFDSLDPWEKICCCKIAPDTFDCDVSLRSMVIYGIIFPFVLENRKLELQEKDNKDELKYCFHSDDDKIFEYRGDTMNSYTTTVHQYILANCNHKDVKFFTPVSNGKWERKWGTVGYDIFETQHLEACILDNYEYFDNILPAEAKEFIRLNHTIGNFIPIPPSVQSRGINSAIMDYWDLTLLVVYNYYIPDEKFKKFDLSNIFKDKESAIKQWLDSFKNKQDEPDWDIFVEKNYMQDFVNYDSETRKYGMPKELWKGHFDSAKQGKVFPIKNDEKDEFAQFFTKASEWIIARGTRMAKELKNKLDREDISEIVNKLSGNDED